MSTIHLPDITGPMDEAIEVLRICAEKSVLADEDLLARLIKARSQAERAGIALHLAEQFVRIAEPARIDSGVAVVGRDLVNAIRRAKGLPAVREHYEALAREARAA